MPDNMLGLMETLKRTDPDGKPARVVNMYLKHNPILEDAVLVEANNKTVHITSIQVGEPTSVWRKLGYGVPNSKSSTKQVTDSCGMLEDYSEIDKATADMQKDTNAFRLNSAQRHIVAMNNIMSEAMFYGDTDINPERFMGLAPRFSVISSDDKKSGYNIIDAGGVGADNCSIWFVTWGEDVCHLIYPEGLPGGLKHQNLGEVTLLDSVGGKFQGYRDHFSWNIGFVVRDWRGVSRIANIDVSDLNAGTVAIEDFMIDAYYKILDSPGKKAIYVTPAVQVALHKRAKNQSNVQLSLMTFEGKEVVTFLGIPIRVTKSLLETETQIV